MEDPQNQKGDEPSNQAIGHPNLPGEDMQDKQEASKGKVSIENGVSNSSPSAQVEKITPPSQAENHFAQLDNGDKTTGPSNNVPNKHNVGVAEVHSSSKTSGKDVDANEGVGAPSERGDSDQNGASSKRVQQGQEWNNRNRDRPDNKKNMKSEFTTQAESSDPVAIRKQASSVLCYFIFVLTVVSRSNSTFPIQISFQINSSTPKSRVTTIFPYLSASFILSNACAIFSHTTLSWLLSKIVHSLT